MFVSLRLITLPLDRLPLQDALVVQLRTAAGALAHVASSWVAPVLAGAVINAGHLVWRMEFTTESHALAVELDPSWVRDVRPLLADTQVTAVGYRMSRKAVRSAGAGIWRALIFRVLPEGFPQQAAALEAGLLMMPKYVPAIRSWALSAVAFVQGPKTFTHVWEQEFDDLSGLTVDYMVHPIHWGMVDAWFDAECPDYVVDPLLVQVVGTIDRTIMH